ncbi:hypothetical protein pSalSNUABM01_162 [Salmonella phage pSal-SNUABM-01]|nr:hypothetical protein pSalSNUABM01_162 [Salmonella phage pSal-SNUABM-01]
MIVRIGMVFSYDELSGLKSRKVKAIARHGFCLLIATNSRKRLAKNATTGNNNTTLNNSAAVMIITLPFVCAAFP